MNENLDVNKVTAEVITDLSKTIAKQLYAKVILKIQKQKMK